MARSVQECYNIITAELETQFTAAGITISASTWSTVNRLRNVCYTIATSQSVSEQLWDDYYDKLNALLSKSPAGSKLWIQAKMFEFQYSGITPQVLTYVDGIPQYATISPLLRIITACAVTTASNNYVKIKTAKGATLAKLDSSEVSAAQDYINTIGTAGVTYDVVSYDPDRLYLEGTIYYTGTYSAVIVGMVVNAINEYLRTLSVTRFGGDLLLSELKAFILNIEGVNDVSLSRVSVRKSTESLFGGSDLVLGSDELLRKYTMFAGYIIEEDTASNTFTDKLTFTAE